MGQVDAESLIWIIQIITLALVAVQSLPQIIALHKGKEEVVQNLSLQSWIAKSMFSVFFVASLFAGEINMVIVATQITNLLMSLIITGQVAYYSHLEIVPKPLQLIYAVGQLEEHELIHEENEYHEIPILHNILKQIYKFDSMMILPKLP